MPLHLFFIGVCLILSLLFIKNNNWVDRVTPIFLLLLLAVECYCYYLKINHKGNNLQYNLWFPVEFTFYTLIICSSYLKKITQKVVIAAVALFGLFVLINYLFFQNLQVFSGKTYLFGTLMLLLASFLKMNELLTQSKISNPFLEPFFWLIIGIITIQLIGIFQFTATDYLFRNHNPLYKALQKINIYLSYFQYVCMIVYFYSKWKLQK